MSTILWNTLKVTSTLLGVSLLIASSASATETVLEKEATNTVSETTVNQADLSFDLAENSLLAQQLPASDNTNQVLDEIESYSEGFNEEGVDSQSQLTSITELTDVSPGDWAYDALRELVEDYKCIVGYPDRTFRGNRPTSRYEFAAGLRACLDRIQELIAAGGTVTEEDLERLRALIQEFDAELAVLGTRVDNLDARVAFLEDHQFSTTTKLKGEVVFAIADVFGDTQAVASPGTPTEDIEANTIFANRARLNFETSFTGRDKLRTRLQARNISSFGSSVTGTNMTRLSFDGSNDNSVDIGELWYRFPVGENLTFQIDATSGDLNDTLINVVNPLFKSSGSGAVSRFGRFNPIYRTGSGGGIGVNYSLGKFAEISGAYFADNASDPSQRNGLFNGSYVAMGQLTLKPSDFFTVAATYANSYYIGGDVNVTGSTGSGFARRPFDNFATSANSYGVETNLRFGKLSVGGWVGYQNAILEDPSAAAFTALGAPRGTDRDIWNWAVNLGITDVGSKGSKLGFIFGMPPRTRGSELANGARRDFDTSYHLEGLYRFKVNKNIAITPGVIVILNPEHNDNNDTIFVGTIRTVFSF
ncbi:MAG: iron uptake porin [Symploca sp. SIO2D2]|nr:iron uptake porin [Symploca sp. SIO2D2]